jgi:hypothetical protein
VLIVLIPVILSGIAKVLMNETMSTGGLVAADSAGRGVPHVDVPQVQVPQPYQSPVSSPPLAMSYSAVTAPPPLAPELALPLAVIT